MIIGGGFGGLYAAKNLRRGDIDVTVIDRKNYHLFQPLLYQVATGGLSPGDITSPVRAILKRHKHARIWQANAVDINPNKGEVILQDGTVPFDSLIVATGVRHAYFGYDEWAALAPGLKTIEDALDMRRRVFLAFEAAEREPDAARRQQLMTFVVVGGGPTGVELAGALGELAHATLKNDFRSIYPPSARIFLIEGKHRVLPTYPPELSAHAEESLSGLGVTVRKQSFVTGIDGPRVTVRHGEREERVEAATVLWAAGVQASSAGEVLARRADAELDSAGRVRVEPDLSLPGHSSIFVIGDLALFTHQGGEPLPGVAPVAIQQGQYVAKLIKRRLAGRGVAPFHYRNKGSLAVIGRHAAVADFDRFRLTGRVAWFAWLLIHIWYLIGFNNKIIVMTQWAFGYFTRNRGARLITGPDPQPLIGERSSTTTSSMGGK